MRLNIIESKTVPKPSLPILKLKPEMIFAKADEIKISPEEYETRLKLAYGEEKADYDYGCDLVLLAELAYIQIEAAHYHLNLKTLEYRLVNLAIEKLNPALCIHPLHSKAAYIRADDKSYLYINFKNKQFFKLETTSENLTKLEDRFATTQLKQSKIKILMPPDLKIITELTGHTHDDPIFKNQFEKLFNALHQWGSDAKISTLYRDGRRNNEIRPLLTLLSDRNEHNELLCHVHFFDVASQGQLPMFLIDIKKNLDKIFSQLHEPSIPKQRKEQQFIELVLKIFNCGPGLYRHIEHHVYQLTTTISFSRCLAEARTNLAQQIVDQHIEEKKIADITSIHAHNVFLNAMIEAGFNPLSKINSITDHFNDTGKMPPELIKILMQEFTQQYNSLRYIADVLCTAYAAEFNEQRKKLEGMKEDKTGLIEHDVRIIEIERSVLQILGINIPFSILQTETINNKVYLKFNPTIFKQLFYQHCYRNEFLVQDAKSMWIEAPIFKKHKLFYVKDPLFADLAWIENEDSDLVEFADLDAEEKRQYHTYSFIKYKVLDRFRLCNQRYVSFEECFPEDLHFIAFIKELSERGLIFANVDLFTYLLLFNTNRLLIALAALKNADKLLDKMNLTFYLYNQRLPLHQVILSLPESAESAGQMELASVLRKFIQPILNRRIVSILKIRNALGIEEDESDIKYSELVQYAEINNDAEGDLNLFYKEYTEHYFKKDTYSYHWPIQFFLQQHRYNLQDKDSKPLSERHLTLLNHVRDGNVKALKESKLDMKEVWQRTLNGYSLVDWAQSTCQQVILNHFFEHILTLYPSHELEKNINFRCYMGDSLFSWAVFLEIKPKIKELIKHKYLDINPVDSNKMIPLMYCISDFEITKFLIENGADINFLSKDNHSIFHYTKSLFAIKYLVSYNANINTIKSPLIHFINQNDLEIIRFLVANGANVNQLDPTTNKTPFEHAIETRNCRVIECLIPYAENVVITMFDSHWKTDWFPALEKNQHFLIALLDREDFLESVKILFTQLKDTKTTNVNHDFANKLITMYLSEKNYSMIERILDKWFAICHPIALSEEAFQKKDIKLFQILMKYYVESFQIFNSKILPNYFTESSHSDKHTLLQNMFDELKISDKLERSTLSLPIVMACLHSLPREERHTFIMQSSAHLVKPIINNWFNFKEICSALSEVNRFSFVTWMGLEEIINKINRDVLTDLSRLFCKFHIKDIVNHSSFIALVNKPENKIKIKDIILLLGGRQSDWIQSLSSEYFIKICSDDKLFLEIIELLEEHQWQAFVKKAEIIHLPFNRFNAILHNGPSIEFQKLLTLLKDVMFSSPLLCNIGELLNILQLFDKIDARMAYLEKCDLDSLKKCITQVDELVALLKDFPISTHMPLIDRLGSTKIQNLIHKVSDVNTLLNLVAPGNTFRIFHLIGTDWLRQFLRTTENKGLQYIKSFTVFPSSLIDSIDFEEVKIRLKGNSLLVIDLVPKIYLLSFFQKVKPPFIHTLFTNNALLYLVDNFPPEDRYPFLEYIEIERLKLRDIKSNGWLALLKRIPDDHFIVFLLQLGSDYIDQLIRTEEEWNSIFDQRSKKVIDQVNLIRKGREAILIDSMLDKLMLRLDIKDAMMEVEEASSCHLLKKGFFLEEKAVRPLSGMCIGETLEQFAIRSNQRDIHSSIKSTDDFAYLLSYVPPTRIGKLLEKIGFDFVKDKVKEVNFLLKIPEKNLIALIRFLTPKYLLTFIASTTHLNLFLDGLSPVLRLPILCELGVPFFKNLRIESLTVTLKKLNPEEIIYFMRRLGMEFVNHHLNTDEKWNDLLDHCPGRVKLMIRYLRSLGNEIRLSSLEKPGLFYREINYFPAAVKQEPLLNQLNNPPDKKIEL